MERPIGRRKLVWSLVTLPVGVYLVACGSDDDDDDTGTGGTSGSGGGSGSGGSSGSGGGKGGSGGSGGGKGGSGGGSGSGGTSGSGGGAGTGGSGGGDLTFTSTNVGDHTHDFTLTDEQLDSPPAGGVEDDTTLDAAHVHTVTLTMAELESIGMGDMVTVTTSLVNSHTHDFTFVRVA